MKNGPTFLDKDLQLLNLNISGYTIACKLWGNPNHPPIIALHGWLDNANSFDQLAVYLQKEFYVIAVDFPGHGHSSHLPEGYHYHFNDTIFLLIDIINALRLDKVHLLGHSMGACLGSLAAGVVPDRFLSLALIDAIGAFSQPENTACQQMSEYLIYLAHKHEKKKRGFKQAAQAAITRSTSEVGSNVSLDIAKRLCDRGLIEKEGVFYWRHDQRLTVFTPLMMTEKQILSCLKKITAKTYLIWADKGYPFDKKIMGNRVKAVSDIRVDSLEGGHHIHMESPEVIGPLLADFFRSITL